MADQAFVNYYELLRVSPEAPAKLIELAARLIGSQYHPKNPDTGDPDKYELVKKAYRTLADGSSRREYDEKLAARKPAEPKAASQGFDEPVVAPSDGRQAVRGERQKRSRIMGLLYAQLLEDPDNPGVSTAELVQQMKMQRDGMLFALWFLREKGLARVTDKGVYSLTTAGCEWVEDGGVPEFTYAEEVRKPNVRALPAPQEEKPASTLVALSERVADNRG